MSTGSETPAPRWSVRHAIGRAGRLVRRRVRGQAIVEFAAASTMFLMIVFGTLDFGRASFMYAELHNAVREGARVGKVKCGDSVAVRQAVIDKSPGLTFASIEPTFSGCTPPDGTVTVRASVNFTLITGGLLGISLPPLSSSATVDVE